MPSVSGLISICFNINFEYGDYLIIPRGMIYQIHFNKYKNIDDWIYDDDFLRTKEEFIKMFKHYAEEINNYHYN
mgnify:CR=1 FL=1